MSQPALDFDAPPPDPVRSARARFPAVFAYCNLRRRPDGGVNALYASNHPEDQKGKWGVVYCFRTYSSEEIALAAVRTYASVGRVIGPPDAAFYAWLDGERIQTIG